MGFSVVILAQGKQERLPGLTLPKALLRLQVCRETLIGRTLRLLREMAPRSSRVLVVGGLAVRQDLLPFPSTMVEIEGKKLAQGADLAVLTLDRPGTSALAGLQQVLPLGGPSSDKRVLVLLGDVAYSRETMSKIIHSDQDVMFAGTRNLTPNVGEVFAMAWAPMAAMRIAHMVGSALLDIPSAHGDVYQPGQLRRALWKHLGFEPHAKELGRRLIEHPSFLTVTDWTRDFDTPEDLERLPEIDQLAALEDERRATGASW
jgi:hypothetical protein